MVRLRDFTPNGYNARHIVILIVPMLVFVIAMTMFFFNSHVQNVNTQLSRSMAQVIRSALDERTRSPQSWDSLSETLRNSGLIETTFVPGGDLTSLTAPARCCRELGSELDVALERPFSVSLERGEAVVRVVAETEGGYLVARLDRKRVMVITAHIFIVWSVGFSALLLATSYAFLRNQVRSILQLSAAADAFGRGEDAPGFRPSGAREVRDAARALIRMRNRIRRYADQRTALLAGVSHDLRTPLTRLRLELSMMPKDVDTGPAREDITEMEGMLDAYLAFARGEEGEQPEETDLLTLASAASEVAARKASLTLRCPTPIRMRVRPLALKRALANLAGNAADYGRNVRITIRREADAALIIVEDDGPGISPAQYEEAFRPFNRLDPARNQNVSGVGLGLTIARDTARAHGGDVILGRSELGGLKASVRLPTSPN